MPELIESEVQSKALSWLVKYLRTLEGQAGDFDEILPELIKNLGATNTLKGMQRARQKPKMATVRSGDMEIHPSGYIEAALDTDDGPKFVYGRCKTEAIENDPQLITHGSDQSDAVDEYSDITPDALLDQLCADKENIPCDLIIKAELTRFDTRQQQRLLPILWSYILAHRNSNNSDELVAIGSAIRKYIALMPMDQMEDLAVLLDSENRSPLPLELELEVSKMIYRNFEARPPAQANPQPKLAKLLWQMAQTYINPRLLLRDKHSAVASLTIEAIVAMRSDLAKEAWMSAMRSSQRWFGEMVSDDLMELWNRWDGVDANVAQWLAALRQSVMDEIKAGRIGVDAGRAGQ